MFVKVKSLKTGSSNSNLSKKTNRPNILPLNNHDNNRKEKTTNLNNQILINLLMYNLDEIIQVDFDLIIIDKSENKGGEITDEYVKESSDARDKIYQLAFQTKKLVKRTMLIYNQIEVNASMFDCDELKSNGYRSVLNVYDACIRRLFLILRDINEKKRRISSSGSIKDFESWSQLLEKLEILLEIVFEMQTTSLSEYKKSVSYENGEKISKTPSMFITQENLAENSKMEENVLRLSSEHSVAFFGKTVGFQFSESLKTPLTGVAIALASYTPKSSPLSVGNKVSSRESLFTTAELNPAESDSLRRNVKSETDLKKLELSEASLNSENTNDTSQSKYSKIKAAKSVITSTKYIVDADSRAKKFTEVIKNADIQFCKEFWQLPESSLVIKGSDLVVEKTAINVLKEIKAETVLKIPKIKNSDEFVDVQPPCNINLKAYINVRILSHDLRKGMGGLDAFKTVESGSSSNNYDQSSLSNYPQLLGKSKSLILHAHGGGFIAQSSRAHEVYLRPWCNELQVPIVSIDYSLAPEHPFPRASEECFYIYAWCLLNKDALGWTGERIICVGDSAGGLLVTNIAQRAIMNGVRIPDALVSFYAPLTLNYSLSPSRLLSVMDPLLNLGILWRCLGAYCGIDYKTEAESFKKNLHVKPKSNFSFNKSIGKRFINRFWKPISIQPIIEFSRPDVNSTRNEENMNIHQNNRLIKLHEIYGDSIFLIEKIKSNPFLSKNPLLSPLLDDDANLTKFPPTFLVSSSTDPFLDDSIELNKKLKQFNVPHDIIVFKNLTHGFLNLANISKDCRKASEKIISHILSNILNEKPIDKSYFN